MIMCKITALLDLPRKADINKTKQSKLWVPLGCIAAINTCGPFTRMREYLIPLLSVGWKSIPALKFRKGSVITSYTLLGMLLLINDVI